MKSKSLLLSFATILFSIASCSKDIDDVNEQNNYDYSGYTFAALTINLNEETKATPGEDGDDNIEGESYENNISEIYLFSFKQSDETLLYKKALSIDNEKSKANLIVTNSFSLPTGDQFIYIVANPENALKLEFNNISNPTKALFENKVFQDQNINSLMMSSYNGPEDVKISKEDASQSMKDPIILNVTLSRVLAKVTYMVEKYANLYPLGSSNSKVTLMDAKLINKHYNSFLFRRVGDGDKNNEALNTIGGKETGSSTTPVTNYVIDPDFYKKNPDYSNSEINSSNKCDYYINDKEYQSLIMSVAQNQLLGYVNENTMHQNAQINTYTTGVILKAKCIIDQSDFADGNIIGTDYETDGTFYMTLDGKLYPSVESIAKAYSVSTSSDPEKDLEGKISYKIYKQGICYYPIWLKHADNNDDTEMGIMEFGIVRNNIYQLKVNSISNIGYTDDEDISDKDDPDEDQKAFLSANITIKPWVVRTNYVNL